MSENVARLPRAPLQRLQLDWLQRAAVELAILRLDLIDPLLGGNKWFKLSGHLQQARLTGADCLASLGGAHSNHLHALAATARHCGFSSLGLLRGHPQDTPTVRDLQAFGMQLHWLGYGGYRERHREDFWDAWRARHPRLYCIDEGGAGLLGARGCEVLVKQARAQLQDIGWSGYDGWWLAAGTGTTLAGLVLGENGQHPVHGATAVPSGHGVERRVAEILREAGCADAGYRLLDASRGAFGKVDAELAGFIRQCEHNGVPLLDPLYTAKALMALRYQVQGGYFPPGTRLIFVHSGGLQGRRAMESRLEALAGPVDSFDIQPAEQALHE